MPWRWRGWLCFVSLSFLSLLRSPFPRVSSPLDIFEWIHPHTQTLTKAKRTVGKIVSTGFTPRDAQSKEATSQRLKEELWQWRNDLPREMKLETAGEGSSLWCKMLHLAYKCVSPFFSPSLPFPCAPPSLPTTD